MLGILDSQRARQRLTVYIGNRMFKRYVSDPYAVPPPVELVTVEEARKRGITQPTGWYDFDKRAIGLVVDQSNTDIKQEMVRLDGTSVHEYAHGLFNIWPQGQDKHGLFLFNVITDASNEQRVILDFPWARQLLRKSRVQRLKLYQANPQFYRGSTEPLYNAAWLTLGAHTALAAQARKGGRLTVLEQLYRGKLNAAEAWPAIEELIGPPDPLIMDKWPEAFQLAVSAWIIRVHQPQVELIRQFRDLFPEPATPPPDSVWDMGGAHDSDNGNGGPPLAPATEPGGKIKAPSAAADSDDDATGDDEDGTDGTDPDEPIQIEVDGPDSDEDPNGDSPGGSRSPYDATPEEIGKEVNTLNRPTERYCPEANRLRSDEEVHQPVDASDLLTRARQPAGQLAAMLRFTRAPEISSHSDHGRVDARVIATEPDAENPFIAQKREDQNSALDTYIAVALDTSGSTGEEIKKHTALVHAGMVSHLALEAARTNYSVVTSRSLLLLAGEGYQNRGQIFKVEPIRSPGLIASLGPGQRGAVGGGDNYHNTFPLLVRYVKERTEAVKILLLVTDGGISITMKMNMQAAESSGILVFALGLDLNAKDTRHLLSIFGPKRAILAKSDKFVDILAQTLVGAIRVGQRIHS